MNSTENNNRTQLLQALGDFDSAAQTYGRSPEVSTREREAIERAEYETAKKKLLAEIFGPISMQILLPSDRHFVCSFGRPGRIEVEVSDSGLLRANVYDSVEGDVNQRPIGCLDGDFPTPERWVCEIDVEETPSEQDWRQAVLSFETTLGYADWVEEQINKDS